MNTSGLAATTVSRGTVFTQKIRRQDFDRGSRRCGANGRNDLGKVLSAAVGQVIAVHGCDHNVFETELRHRVTDVGRLLGVERRRQAGAHIAKRTGPGAGIPHNHQRGVALRPALPDIRTTGFFTYRDKAMLFDDGAGLIVLRRARRLDADPRRFAQQRGIFARHFFRMAHVSLDRCVNQRDHLKALSQANWGQTDSAVLMFKAIPVP